MSSYVYNAGVDAKLKSATKLMKLAPNKEKLNEFNEQITKTLYGVIYCFNLLIESGFEARLNGIWKITRIIITTIIVMIIQIY